MTTGTKFVLGTEDKINTHTYILCFWGAYSNEKLGGACVPMATSSVTLGTTMAPWEISHTPAWTHTHAHSPPPVTVCFLSARGCCCCSTSLSVITTGKRRGGEGVEGQADEWDGKANFKDRWVMKKDEERCRETKEYQIGCDGRRRGGGTVKTLAE